MIPLAFPNVPQSFLGILSVPQSPPILEHHPPSRTPLKGFFVELQGFIQRWITLNGISSTQLGCSRKLDQLLLNGLSNLLINGIYWGDITHWSYPWILTSNQTSKQLLYPGWILGPQTWPFLTPKNHRPKRRSFTVHSPLQILEGPWGFLEKSKSWRVSQQILEVSKVFWKTMDQSLVATIFRKKIWKKYLLDHEKVLF